MKQKALSSLLVILTLLYCNTTFAQLSTKVTVATNYITMGRSNTTGGGAYNSAGQPVVQGSLDYQLGDFSAQVFTSACDTINLTSFATEKDTEVDYTLSYSKKVDDWTFGAFATHYAFMRNEGAATTVWDVNVMWLFARVDYLYTSNYAGTQSSLAYTNLSVFLPMSEKVMFTGSTGRSVWGTETNVGMSSYNDYKVGLRMTMSPTVEGEMAYTNTSGRKDLAVTNEEVKTDKALTFSISTKFDL